MHQNSKFYLRFPDRVNKKKVDGIEHMKSVCPFCMFKKNKKGLVQQKCSRGFMADARKRKVTSISAKERKPGQSKQSRAWVQKKRKGVSEC